MKIAKKYRPELVVSKGKEPNPLLTDPYLDVKEDRLIATDGHCLVSLPVETDKSERSRYLACNLIKAGTDGWPDRLVIWAPGRHFWIEFKTPTGRLTTAQKVRIPRLMARGEEIYVVTSASEALALLAGRT